jgi:hypothetical protein
MTTTVTTTVATVATDEKTEQFGNAAGLVVD